MKTTVELNQNEILEAVAAWLDNGRRRIKSVSFVNTDEGITAVAVVEETQG